MVAIVHPPQLSQRLVVGHRLNLADGLSQTLDVGLQLCFQFFSRDAADALVPWIEGQHVQVVQLAEYRQLRELRDARQEDEAQQVLHRLQRREQAAYALADIVLQVAVGDAVEHRGVVLVDEHHHLAARLLIGSLDNTLQPVVVIILIIDRNVPPLFVVAQDAADGAVYPLFFIILTHRQVEPDDRILRPLRLQLLNGQSAEQLLAPLEVGLKRAHQERLAEAARTAQEEVLALRLCHLIHIRRLVNVDTLALDHLGEGLQPYAVSSFRCHNSFSFLRCKYKQFFAKRQERSQKFLWQLKKSRPKSAPFLNRDVNILDQD